MPAIRFKTYRLVDECEVRENDFFWLWQIDHTLLSLKKTKQPFWGSWNKKCVFKVLNLTTFSYQRLALPNNSPLWVPVGSPSWLNEWSSWTTYPCIHGNLRVPTSPNMPSPPREIGAKELLTTTCAWIKPPKASFWGVRCPWILMVTNSLLVGGWTNPSEKYARQPIFGVKIQKNIWGATTNILSILPAKNPKNESFCGTVSTIHVGMSTISRWTTKNARMKSGLVYEADSKFMSFPTKFAPSLVINGDLTPVNGLILDNWDYSPYIAGVIIPYLKQV